MALGRAMSRVVAGTSYLVHPQVLGNVVEKVSPSDILPVVLVSDLTGENTIQEINERLTTFAQIDDVYHEEFGNNVVIVTAGTEPSPADLTTRLNMSGNFSAIYSSRPNSTVTLPSGPYFLHGSDIHQAWRLYPDDLDAFIFGVIPEDVRNPNRYSIIESLTPDGIFRNVAVPSRLYAKPTAERPLAGARMGIKDIYKLSGVKSTMMSRAYTELYGPDESSSNYIKKLISLGAVIVGKTKMTSFASSEEPTDQWIDFHCPVNPRGDRYQSPSGSSSGAAAALAGYPWLDYSVAGDSAGSVRAPATCNGLFSLRASFSSTSMEGVAVNSPEFDVVGHFSRDLSDLHHIISHTLDVSDKSKTFPTKILYPLDFFPHSNKIHQAMVDQFTSILENLLGTKRVEFSIAERWSQCPPEAAEGKPLKEYLAKSAFWSMCRDYNKEFTKYRNDYQKKFGKKAYESTIVQFRWDTGKNVSDKEYENYLGELAVFRNWFDQNVMSFHPESLSDAIMIMPYGSANPKYRDAPNEAPSTSHTIGEKFISPVLQMPQLVLPFGQMPYQSRISGLLEHRPIGSTLVGAKGSDLMLIKLARAAFKAASWPTTIATGRFMFSIGDNVRNVEDSQEASTEQPSFLGVQDQVRKMYDSSVQKSARL